MTKSHRMKISQRLPNVMQRNNHDLERTTAPRIQMPYYQGDHCVARPPLHSNRYYNWQKHANQWLFLWPVHKLTTQLPSAAFLLKITRS